MLYGGFGRTGGRIQGRSAHFFAVPLLAAPAQALGINDAGPGSAAAFIFLHGNIKFWRMD
jgi:hypothetical protein